MPLLRLCPGRKRARNTASNTTMRREYKYRRMVRGHWRRLPEKSMWIKAYIKGPAGAPWKGRPVYKVTA